MDIIDLQNGFSCTVCNETSPKTNNYDRIKEFSANHFKWCNKKRLTN